MNEELKQELRWNYNDHVMRYNEERSLIIKWKQYDGKRTRGRSPIQLADYLKMTALLIRFRDTGQSMPRNR